MSRTRDKRCGLLKVSNTAQYAVAAEFEVALVSTECKYWELVLWAAEWTHAKINPRSSDARLSASIISIPYRNICLALTYWKPRYWAQSGSLGAVFPAVEVLICEYVPLFDTIKHLIALFIGARIKPAWKTFGQYRDASIEYPENLHQGWIKRQNKWTANGLGNGRRYHFLNKRPEVWQLDSLIFDICADR